MSSHRHRWGPIKSLLALSPVFIGAPLFALRQHYALPKPLTDLTNSLTGLPQISESRILEVARLLSEDIGYRTVGTYEHALADAWMVKQAEAIQAHCEEIVRESGRKLECEVWRQEGSGSHRFDMMHKRLYKTYVNLTNIVIRVSDGTDDGKAHAVLINSHLDSTLPSPGAADDALPVGVMLECIRVLVDTPGWSPKHAIVFLFNHAEESLQDGSHLFSTQHPVASTVRAVINLEAAGTTGRELLFQATSEQMIEAYSHVPRPFGTIFANDIFSSGIILSDTDFRQFEHYLNVTGLDMAIVGNSYLYHMRKDLVENIEAGVAQHMAENALALLQYLSSDLSPLPTLTQGYTRPSTVFFSHIGHFFIYSFTTAKIIYGLLFFSSLILVRFTYVNPAPAMRKGGSVWAEQAKGMGAVVVGVLGAVIAPNLVAVIMQRVLGKSMSWFSSQYSAIGLYGPPAFLGALLSQYLYGPVHEKTLLTALLLMQSSIAFGVQMINIGSAAMPFLSALPLFVVLLLNPILSTSPNEVSLLTYALGQIFPLLNGVLMIIPVIEVFVPLTGRIGADAPADNLIATIVSALGALALPLIIPLAHRFGRRALYRGVVLMSMVTIVLMAVFSMRHPFDAMHQKRLFVLHLENITSREQHLHLSAADGAPGFDALVTDIVGQFGPPGVPPAAVIMDDYNSDWDSLYPFSAFLSPYKVSLPVDSAYVSPWTSSGRTSFSISASTDIRNFDAGTRNLTLTINHPGLIWTVIAFDAHVLHWTLDGHPPDEYTRHHVKEASFYGTDAWTLELVVKVPPGSVEEGLRVNFIGIQEKGMWPGKKAFKADGGIAMRLFEEIDGWLEQKTEGTVDATLLGCVAGVAVI